MVFIHREPLHSIRSDIHSYFCDGLPVIIISNYGN
jgi:hypothetical protein